MKQNAPHLYFSPQLAQLSFFSVARDRQYQQLLCKRRKCARAQNIFPGVIMGP